MITVDVDGTEYEIPSSAADTNWAAKQVAFEQAMLEYLDNTATTADGAAATVEALELAVKPEAVEGTAGSGTGISGASTNYGRHVVHKISIARQAVQTADTSRTVLIWTLPTKTRVLRVVADVTAAFAGGSIAACTLKTGVAENGTEFLLSGDIFTAPIVLGDAQSELGANIVGGTGFSADTFWSAQGIYATFTSSGANLSELTTGAVTFYVEACTYP